MTTYAQPGRLGNPGDSIIVVGAGAFGSSLALELVTKYCYKYISVDVFDKWPVPSRDAASTDTSKIIREDYKEPMYIELTDEAINLWSTDLFKGTYHQGVGMISVYDEKDSTPSEIIKNLRNLGLASGIVEFGSGKEITNKWKAINGPMDGRKGYFNPSAGRVNSSQATSRVALAAQDRGARFHSGSTGEIVSLVYDSKGSKVTGVKAKSGITFYADKIVLCTGAQTNDLIDTKGQMIAKGHILAEIQLTLEEKPNYANIPILLDFKSDVYYYPHFDGNAVVKVGAIIAKYQGKTDPSDHPTDGIGKNMEEHLRRALRVSIPSLADKELSDARVCWDSHTADLHFLLTPHPEVAGLYIAGGGSGHGFKLLPIIGHYIALMLEGNLPLEYAQKWKWRPGQTHEEDPDLR